MPRNSHRITPAYPPPAYYNSHPTFTAEQNMAARESAINATNITRSNYSSDTLRSYSKYQQEFKRWCDVEFNEDEHKYIIFEMKLIWYLEKYVMSKTVVKHGVEVPISWSTACLHVAAVIDLYNQQCSAGANSYPHPRSARVSGLLESIKKSECERNRSTYADRQENTLLDGFTTSRQVAEVMDWYLHGNKSSGLRDRMCLSLTIFNLLRGQTMRLMELADLFSLELEREGVMECHAVVMIMRQGKTNTSNRLDYAASLRNANVNVCPHGALAL